MILIAYLKLATNPANDPYWRPRLDHLRPVELEKEVESTRDHYVIDKLLGKRISKGQTQYLVKWLGYGPKHDIWYDITHLDLAKNHVDKYNWDHETRLPPGARAFT